MQRQLDKVYRTFQEKQPIALTGTARHVMLWAMAPWIETLYQNPGYQQGKRKVSIYCVHGTADRAGAFSLVAERLVNQLPACVSEIHLVAFEERGKGKDIAFFARQLKNQIKINKDEDVILIGHSRGGVVAAYFAEYLAQANNVNVHSLITICSPFSGSDLARPPFTWVSDSICEMQPHSQFLNQLTRQIEQSDIPYHYFSASKDEIVAPDKCVIPAHQQKRIELDRHNHLSILSSHRLVYQIKSYLEKDLAPILTNSANPSRN